MNQSGLRGFCVAVATGMLALGPATATGALEWEHRELSVDAQLGETQARVQYPYRNTGSRPVTIISVRPGCGCSEATPQRVTVEPGGSGEVELLFRFEDRVGAQKIVTRVITDNRRNRIQELVLNVDIPEALRLRPRGLIWRANEAGVTKVATLRVNPEIHVESTQIEAPDGLTATLTVDEEDPHHYFLSVTAEEWEERAQHTVSVVIKCRDEIEFRASVPVRLM